MSDNVTAGCVNKQVFANSLKDMSVLCSQLASAAPKWSKKSINAGLSSSRKAVQSLAQPDLQSSAPTLRVSEKSEQAL